MPNYKSFNVRQERAVTIASLRYDQLSGLDAYVILREDLTSLMASEKPQRLLINFAGVELMGSDAIGVFIHMRKELKKSGGQLKLCCMGEHVRLAFKVLNLDGTLFQILDSEADGIEAFDR